jgi:catechol 2,3-dioxygenase
MEIPSGTTITQVHLQTRNVGRLRQFYVEILGFREVSQEGNTIYLSANGYAPAQIILTENSHLLPLSRHSPGLFHTAFLLPDRMQLGLMLQQLMAHQIRLGFGDHAVSEAIYLSDPDGNGIELYADRPREEWPVKNGQIEMTTGPVDTAELLRLARLQGIVWNGIDAGTRIGHIHLQVSSLAKAEQFYYQLLGFNITQRSYPGALFVSAGGYHHHLGLNTWNSKNASPAADSTGLQSFTIFVPDAEYISNVAEKLSQAGLLIEQHAPEIFCQDFDSIHLRIKS